MDFPSLADLLSGILQIASALPYFRSILKRKTKPNIVSFILWATLQTIAVTAQITEGWSWSAVLLLAGTLNAFIVIGFCLRGDGYWKDSSLDWVCFGGAVLALFAWAFTHSPFTALFITFAVYIFAAIPTIVKVAKFPETEDSLAWFITALAGFFSILSVTERNFANLAFPIDYFLEGLIIGGIAYWGHRKKSNQRT